MECREYTLAAASPSTASDYCASKDATAERAKMQLHIQVLHLKFTDLYRSALV